MIPEECKRELNYIWLGRERLHPLMLEWREKWEQLHPGWLVRTWTEGDDPEILTCGEVTIRSQNPDLLPLCCHLSQKSNVWRYDLVEQVGGVYLDADFEPVRPIDDLVRGTEAFAGTSWVDHGGISQAEPACSLFGAVAHHPWAQDLVANLKTRDPSESRSMGFGYFTEVTRLHPEVKLYVPSTFYSQNWNEPAHYKKPTSPLAYAVHRWSSKWFPPSFRPVR